MYADVLMIHLADVKLHKDNWNRGQGEFINHYRIQKNKFNEIAPDSMISDPHAVRMLHNVVSGTPNLAPVLNKYRRARKAACSTINISFDEYCTLLSEQAQAYNNANTRTKNSYQRTANVHDLIEDDMEYEANVHKANDDDDQEPDLSEILEANVNAQRDKGTGRYVPRMQNGTNNQKRQANQMQGRRAYMTQDTWNSIPKDDQVKWDSLSDKTKLTVTTYHFNKGKEYALRDTEANKMEAKQHDMVFDANDEDDNSVIEAKNHEVTPPQVNDAYMTRKLYEEEGIDFGQILQAQKANTRLFTRVHEFEPEEESDDDEEYTGLEVNSHWFKGFDDDEEGGEGSEEYFNEIADVLNAFGATQPNATSNASQGTSTGDANATVVRNSNNASVPRTRRGRNEPVATDTIYADTAAVSTSIQEEKTVEGEQEDADEEDKYYELATDVYPELFGGTTINNTTPEQTAPSKSSPSSGQIAPPKSSSPMATSPAPSNSNTSPVQVTTLKKASPMASSPIRPNPTQFLMLVISTKPEDANAENIAKQPSPMQASPSKASPSSGPKQPVTPVISTRLITADGENTANTLSIQQSPKQNSPTQETQIALIAEPENTSINKSESSGTNESEKGVMTRQKAVTKGKELKGVNEAKDPEAKAKLLRAIARHRKEKEQRMVIDANKQDKDKVGSSNSPQPKPSNTDPQVRSPVVTFKTEALVTSPMRSPSTKTSSSTPSDLTKSDSLRISWSYRIFRRQCRTHGI